MASVSPSGLKAMLCTGPFVRARTLPDCCRDPRSQSTAPPEPPALYPAATVALSGLNARLVREPFATSRAGPNCFHELTVQRTTPSDLRLPENPAARVLP